ncbi:MAG: DUF427 domain-containing protein [Deltaproteobacteria bacterium]|nr:DUF427 domain-containing protein [Deltaproteobacteria bacterium]
MEKHPDHAASFEYPEDHYLVKVGNSVILDTTHAILVKEVSPKGTYPPVLYFPKKDARKEILISTDLHTFCPLKGEANYYSLSVDGRILENAVWYYPEPLDHVKEIASYLSFYPDKVEIVKEA